MVEIIFIIPESKSDGNMYLNFLETSNSKNKYKEILITKNSPEYNGFFLSAKISSFLEPITCVKAKISIPTKINWAELNGSSFWKKAIKMKNKETEINLGGGLNLDMRSVRIVETHQTLYLTTKY